MKFVQPIPEAVRIHLAGNAQEAPDIPLPPTCSGDLLSARGFTLEEL